MDSLSEWPEMSDETPRLYAAADSLGFNRNTLSELSIPDLQLLIALALMYRRQARGPRRHDGATILARRGLLPLGSTVPSLGLLGSSAQTGGQMKLWPTAEPSAAVPRTMREFIRLQLHRRAEEALAKFVELRQHYSNCHGELAPIFKAKTSLNSARRHRSLLSCRN